MVVNVLFEHDEQGRPHGCSFIRLLLPLSHPKVAGRVRLLASADLAPETADVVIVERWWRSDVSTQKVDALIAEVRRRNSKLIYTLDDNLLDISNDQFGSPSSIERRRCTYALLREADCVVVSTDTLAQRVRGLCRGCVLVVPNALDERIFSSCIDRNSRESEAAPVGRNGEVTRIGYMGTFTHFHDLQILFEPLRRLSAIYGNRIEFELIGVGEVRAEIMRALGNRARYIVVPPGGNYVEFVRWFSSSVSWDIAVAPLRTRRFNIYKSDLKYLDYGICGIPAVFSRLPPYLGTIQSGVNGILVDNDPEQWFGALDFLIQDRAARLEMGRSAFAEIVRNRTLMQVAPAWLVALCSVSGVQPLQA